MSYNARNPANEKLWMPPNAIAVMKKKEKHIHIAGKRMKSRTPSVTEGNAQPAASPFAGDTADIFTSSVRNRSRYTISTSSTVAGMNAAASNAMRQLDRLAMVVRNAGAAAHPRLPEMPCTENACARRGVDTSLLSSVKSDGWNTLLPRPASMEP